MLNLVLRPGQWFAPPSSLHITLLEITHSTPASTLSTLLSSRVLLETIQSLATYTSSHPSALHFPLLNLDATALSLSFLPSPLSHDSETYHHLRESLFELYTAPDAYPTLNARYVVPSAHITLGRFLKPLDAGAVYRLVREVEKIKEWLANKMERREWKVGKEGVVEVRAGEVWYGGGGVLAKMDGDDT